MYISIVSFSILKYNYVLQLPGFFTLLPRSNWDYAMNIYNDSYTCQNQQPDGGATAGKMLGGSGSIDHMIHVPACPEDYVSWGKAANDSSWYYEDFIQCFIKSEAVKDEGVLAQNTTRHGTCGPMKLKKQESTLNAAVIAGLVEQGVTYKNDTDGLCVTEPLLAIDDKSRQCGNVGYLSKVINNENVTVLTGAVVTKINFNGTEATGVQFTYGGSNYNVSANLNVIVSAGAINSAKLLLLSGIGDNETLTGLGIDTVVHNPEVGQNLMDHPACVIGVALDKNTATTSAADPYNFPVPMTTSYFALNESQTQPELQYISLFFPPNSSGMLQLCSYGFKYLDWICDAWYEYNINRNYLKLVVNLLHPASKGSVTLNCKNTTDQPIMKLGLYNNSADLTKMAQLLNQTFEPFLNSNALQSLGAEFVDLGICTDHAQFSVSFWECYALNMSSTMWHYSGTCMMGMVVDANLSVMGTTNLKVIDASAMPGMPSGNIGSAVRAMAEKASGIIKLEDGWTTNVDHCS